MIIWSLTISDQSKVLRSLLTNCGGLQFTDYLLAVCSNILKLIPIEFYIELVSKVFEQTLAVWVWELDQQMEYAKNVIERNVSTQTKLTRSGFLIKQKYYLKLK